MIIIPNIDCDDDDARSLISPYHFCSSSIVHHHPHIYDLEHFQTKYCTDDHDIHAMPCHAMPAVRIVKISIYIIIL